MENRQAFHIRFATVEDVELIYSFINKLAKYEKMEDQVVATLNGLETSIFERKEAEVLIAEENNQPIGFALFFKTYSTFLGKSNYYLEDLFINKEKRGLGYGQQILAFLANTVYHRGADRLEWVCLDWNTSSIDFYKHLGAEPLHEWTTFRLSGDALKNLSKKHKS